MYITNLSQTEPKRCSPPIANVNAHEQSRVVKTEKPNADLTTSAEQSQQQNISEYHKRHNKLYLIALKDQNSLGRNQEIPIDPAIKFAGKGKKNPIKLPMFKSPLAITDNTFKMEEEQNENLSETITN